MMRLRRGHPSVKRVVDIASPDETGRWIQRQQPREQRICKANHDIALAIVLISQYKLPSAGINYTSWGLRKGCVESSTWTWLLVWWKTALGQQG